MVPVKAVERFATPRLDASFISGKPIDDSETNLAEDFLQLVTVSDSLPIANAGFSASRPLQMTVTI